MESLYCEEDKISSDELRDAFSRATRLAGWLPGADQLWSEYFFFEEGYGALTSYMCRSVL